MRGGGGVGERLLWVVSATRRPDSRANSRTVASTPSHVGLRAAYSSRVS